MGKFSNTLSLEERDLLTCFTDVDSTLYSIVSEINLSESLLLNLVHFFPLNASLFYCIFRQSNLRTKFRCTILLNVEHCNTVK